MIKRASLSLLTVFIVGFLLLSSCDTVTETKIAGFSEIEKAFAEQYHAEVLDSSEIDWENFGEYKTFIVERCFGIVTDAENGDGRLLNTYDSVFNYISYRSCGIELRTGMVVITYLVYPPHAECDEIIARYDFVF